MVVVVLVVLVEVVAELNLSYEMAQAPGTGGTGGMEQLQALTEHQRVGQPGGMEVVLEVMGTSTS